MRKTPMKSVLAGNITYHCSNPSADIDTCHVTSTDQDHGTNTQLLGNTRTVTMVSSATPHQTRNCPILAQYSQGSVD